MSFYSVPLCFVSVGPVRQSFIDPNIQDVKMNAGHNRTTQNMGENPFGPTGI